MKTPLFGLVCLACAPAVVSAQAVLTGSVTDPAGAPLAGAIVEARVNSVGETVDVTSTDEGGQYWIAQLSAGLYTVTFTHSAMRRLVRERVALTDFAIAIMTPRLITVTVELEI
jgi:protocatechuate 3,4-dioxygenase beta subunit